MRPSIKHETDPKKLLATYSMLMYAQFFLIAVSLLELYPSAKKLNALALIPPIFLTVLICAVLFWQSQPLRKIDLKLYRASLLINTPSLIIALATIDWTINLMGGQNFHPLITKLDTVYFAITTMATVGSGNIYPASQLARMVISVQVVLGFVFLAFIIQREITSTHYHKNN